LLKLKRVEIHGFKSFYDRTEMKFTGSGIAAVVGPNGCGKSNLSDAISWVLGEQSAKSLRGARMEDVIFAGTRDRKPLGMAAVTMTLVPEQGDETAVVEASESEAQKTADRHGEITITRRLYRSGESEYLINGKLARLRDIQDLFFGTGLGPESYAIIEQGRIGQILSNKPQDRRGVIEEAAGITKFKTRKRLAEAKLESAKQNLSRVFDILEEVTRQANSLKRQAAKTKRYGELKSEATDYLRQLLAAKFRRLERETAKVAIELSLASAQLQSAQSAIGEREEEQTRILESSYATEQELTAARQQLADLSLEAERARGRLEYQAKQVGQIEQRLDAGAEEARLLEHQRAERATELEQQTADWQTLDTEFSSAQTQLDAKGSERQEWQRRLAEQERGIEAARQSVLRMLGDCAGLKNRITQVEAQLEAADRDTTRARTEEQQSEEDLRNIEVRKSQLAEDLAARQAELASVSEQRQAAERELNENRTRLHENRQAMDRLGTEYSRIKARKDSLDEVIQHRSYTTEPVKRLFSAAERGAAADVKPVGVLADFLEVDAQYEKATEEFLHDELEFVVVRNWEDAERGVELIRSEPSGRATFLTEHAEGEHDGVMELPQPSAPDGALTRLTDVLRFNNGLADLKKHLLPRIANCYVTAEQSLARQLATQFPHCWFLTPEGVHYHGRSVSGGKKTGSGPLALKRELREVARLETSKHAELTNAQLAVSELEAGIAALAERLEHLRAGQQVQEKEVLALDHESRKLGEELHRVEGRLSHARRELERISRDRVTLEETVARDREALAAREQARGEEERSLEAAREELTSVQQDVARAAEEHAALRANLASLEERRRAIEASRRRLEGQLREFSNRGEALAHEAERLRAEKTQFLHSNEELQARSRELSATMAETEAGVGRLAEQEADLRMRLTASEEELKRLRAEAQAGQERRSELQVALAHGESDLRHLEETCQKELDTSLPQLVEGMETIADEEALVEIDSRYAEVRRKIEALGPVNPQALEEFQEAEQRQDFLNAQRQDLLDSIRDTEKAIQEIDVESRKRFAEAFQAINANFRVMFQVLFGGGVGEMRLTDEENLAESGIDIVASPPGKKLQSVLLLSGGEKSLTAMALLMGIFQYTPSPFCILDEVDAPLDEPNIQRLTRLLQEMSQQTQFIVITHAKRTMEAAQALYGVTMQEPGVSKLVSVKFKAATETRPAARVEPVREEDLEPVMA
jgi:chromosome segregation protein